MSNLRQIHGAHDDVAVVAAEAGSSWTQAVKGYLARRKRELMTGISRKPTFDADKIKAQIRVMPEVMLALTGTQDEVQASDEGVIAKYEGEPRDAHLLRLASLLTPPGWRDHVLPVLEKRRDQALADWLEDKEPEKNLALAAEVEHLMMFLSATESDSWSVRRDVSPSAA